jgi:site-specific recombinase XerD
LGLEGDVHRLRHTYASRLEMKGVDLLSIKTLMGHTDLKTTQIYAHLAPQHLRDVVKVLNVSEPKSA